MYEAPKHGANFDVSANPESFAKEEALDSKDLKNKLPALVKFSQWKKIEVIEKEKKKYVTRIVEIEKDRQDFIDILADQTASSRVT